METTEVIVEIVSEELWERKIQLYNRLHKVDNGNYAKKGLMSNNQGIEDNLLIKSLIDVSNRIECIEEKIVDFSLLEDNEEKIKNDFEIIEIELDILEGIINKHEKIIESLEVLENIKTR